jgi:hypothetical protein
MSNKHPYVLYIKQYTVLALLCIFSIQVIVSCKKDASHADQVTPISDVASAAATDRTETLTTEWLIAFQAKLKAVVQNQTIDETGYAYTLTEMADGSEALINIGSKTYVDKVLQIHRRDSFVVTATSNSAKLKEIYQKSYGNYVSYYQAQPAGKAYPHHINIETKVQNGTTKVFVESTLAFVDACYQSTLPPSTAGPCDVFSANTAYYAGGGDAQLQLQGLYFNPMCNLPCGRIPACIVGPTTGFEAIQEAINTIVAPMHIPPAPAGKKFMGWKNIECKDVNVTFARTACVPPPTDMLIGTCMDATLLNCIYCQIKDNINTPLIPIPQGKYFVSINLGHDHCFCADSVCDYILTPYSYATVCYGEPIFEFLKIIYWEDPVVVVIGGNP